MWNTAVDTILVANIDKVLMGIRGLFAFLYISLPSPNVFPTKVFFFLHIVASFPLSSSSVDHPFCCIPVFVVSDFLF